MKFKSTFLSAFVFASLVSSMAIAKTPDQKMEEIVGMLKENPTIIDGLHDSLSRFINQQENIDKTLKINHDYIYNNPKHSSFGAKNPKLTIVNMTDYSCPWCKKLDPVLYQLVDKYPNDVKVINIYVPLKEMSDKANSSTYALNVWNNDPEKYANIHKILIGKPGAHDDRSIAKIAKKTNTMEHLQEDKISGEMIVKNLALFNDLGMRGTPAIIINDEIFPGFMPLEKLEPLIKEKLAKQEK